MCLRSHIRVPNGGGERDRTDDLLRAKQALSQLSYTPLSDTACHLRNKNIHFLMVGPSGIEPLTSRLSGVRSNQLSYGPESLSGIR